MPRRIYTYDAGQGWDDVQPDEHRRRGHPHRRHARSSSTTSSRSLKTGAIAGNDPWERRHARVVDPVAAAGVQLRAHPARDVAPAAVGRQARRALNAEVPHTARGDRRIDVDVGEQARRRQPSTTRPAAIRRSTASRACTSSRRPARPRRSSASRCRTRRSSRCICAVGMTIMFTGLLFIHKDKMSLALATDHQRRALHDDSTLRVGPDPARGRTLIPRGSDQ